MNRLHHRKFVSCDVINEFQKEQLQFRWVNNIDIPTTHEIESVSKGGLDLKG
jgi:hypothetical protein